MSFLRPGGARENEFLRLEHGGVSRPGRLLFSFLGGGHSAPRRGSLFLRRKRDEKAASPLWAGPPLFAPGSCGGSAEEGLAGAPRSAAPGNWWSNHSACRPCTRWPMVTCQAKPLTDMEETVLRCRTAVPLTTLSAKHRTMAANQVSGRDCVPHSLLSRRPTGAVDILPD